MSRIIFFLLICLPNLQAAEFLNLMEQDFNQRPELRRFIPLLNNVVQILAPVDRRKPVSDHYAIPPFSERPAGDYLPSCSGSFISRAYFATAVHCYWRMGLARTREWILRKHKYELQVGRLIRVDYEDFYVYPQIITQNHDTVILALRNYKSENFFQFMDENIPFNQNSIIHMLGFPNNHYGVPFLSYNCQRIPSRTTTFDTNCTLLGGMSGGPQFLDNLRNQISVNSATQERPIGNFRTMGYFIEVPYKKAD